MTSVTEQLRDVALREGVMKYVSAVVVKQVTSWSEDDTGDVIVARLFGKPCDEFDCITTDHPFEEGYIRWGLLDKGPDYIKLEGVRGL